LKEAGTQLDKLITKRKLSEEKILADKFEFEGSFGMSLNGVFREIKVTPNLEFFFSFLISV
jgi:hypothetical protein